MVSPPLPNMYPGCGDRPEVVLEVILLLFGEAVPKAGPTRTTLFGLVPLLDRIHGRIGNCEQSLLELEQRERERILISSRNYLQCFQDG